MQSNGSLKTRFSIVRPLVIITAAVVLVGWAISQIGSGNYAKSNLNRAGFSGGSNS